MKRELQHAIVMSPATRHKWMENTRPETISLVHDLLTHEGSKADWWCLVGYIRNFFTHSQIWTAMQIRMR